MSSAKTDFQLAVELFKTKDYAAALVLFKSAQQQGLDSVSLHYNLASCYFKLENYAAAKRHYLRVREQENMRDLVDYNLGLIAIKLGHDTEAADTFKNLIAQSDNKKLIALARQQLVEIKRQDERMRLFLSLAAGHDNNITATPDDTNLGIEDSYIGFYGSLDWLLAGDRSNGWSLDAGYFGVDFDASDSHDEHQYLAGIKRSVVLDDWITYGRVGYSNNYYGGDRYQSVLGVDLRAKRKLSPSHVLMLRYRFDDLTSESIIYDYLEGTRQRAQVEFRRYQSNSRQLVRYEFESNDRGRLTTSSYSYDYSPVRHTLRGKYTWLNSEPWQYSLDLSYRYSDYPASTDFDRDDSRWNAVFTADYLFDKSFKFNVQLQWTDNQSTVSRYEYDKAVIKLGLNKLF